MGYSHHSRAIRKKLSLTWFDPRQCWKKKSSGSTKYFKFPNTAKGYQQALTALSRWQESINEPPDPEGKRQRLQAMSDWYTEQGDPRGAAIGKLLKSGADPGSVVENMGLTIAAVNRLGIDLGDTRSVLELIDADLTATEELKNPRIWQERFERPKKNGVSVEQAVEMFVNEKLSLVKAGKRAPATLASIRDRLRIVRQFLPMSVASIDALAVSRVYSKLTETKLSGARQKNIWIMFRTFLNWCFEQELIDVPPRNIKSKRFEFSDDHQDRAKMIFTPKEIRSMLETLPARGRAAVLLATNCGLTPADLAVLRKGEVDLKAGRIIYKRIKTRKQERVPTANYKLWPETIAALKATKSNHPELWFSTEDGNPLRTSKLKADGSMTSIWSVLATQWTRWRGAGLVPNRPLKGLRKTSSTAIENGPYKGWEQLFLGHAPETVAGRHYVVRTGQPIPEFDKALDWLRDQFLLPQ